jgi:hypothetical protein
MKTRFLDKTDSFIICRKPWYESIQDEIGNSPPELSNSTQLTLMYIPPDLWKQIVTVDIKRVVNVAHIYHLIISEEKIFIGILIPIINSLPELLSIKIHSLSFDVPEDMDTEDIDILFSTIPTSKITKVYLEKVSELKRCIFSQHFVLVCYVSKWIG